MTKQVNIDDIEPKFKYLLMRGRFEMNTSIQNVAFMIEQHLDDQDDSYLNSDLHKRLVKRAEYTTSINNDMEAGIVYKIFEKVAPNLKPPIKYSIENFDCSVLLYQEQ